MTAYWLRVALETLIGAAAGFRSWASEIGRIIEPGPLSLAVEPM
jgi:hypothetical protein